MSTTKFSGAARTVNANSEISGKTEHHAYQCHALIIPIEIMGEVESGAISVKQAVLLAVINALVKVNGEGCWASYKWLSKRIQTEHRQVERYVKDLLDKGFLIEHQNAAGRRFFETPWSRVNASTQNKAARRKRKGQKPELLCPPPKDSAPNPALSHTSKMTQGGLSHTSKMTRVTHVKNDAHIKISNRIDTSISAPDGEDVRDFVSHSPARGCAAPPGAASPLRGSGASAPKDKDKTTPVKKEEPPPPPEKKKKGLSAVQKNSIPIIAPLNIGPRDHPSTNGDEDHARANKLFEALAKKGLVHPHRTKITSWAKDFKKLRTEDQVPGAQIDAVLAWYLIHLGEKFVPEAFCARSFRDKFLKLKRRQEAGSETAARPSQDERITGPDTLGVREVLRLTSHLKWPGGAGQDVRQGLPQALQGYETFLDDLRVILETHGRQRDPGGFAGHLLRHLPNDPVAFMAEWLEKEHRIISRYDDFYGRLKPWAVDNPRFVKKLYSLATEYAGRDAEWDELREALEKLPR